MPFSPAAQLSEDTWNKVRDDFETLHLESYREGKSEDNLDDISEKDLLEAKNIAIERHERHKELVQKKCHDLMPLVGAVSLPTLFKNSPISISLTGFIIYILRKYSTSFDTELEFRQYIIENATFSETKGEQWTDNRRRDWNLAFYMTKIILGFYFFCILYEMSPTIYERSWEVNLAKQEGEGFKEFMRIGYGKRELERLKNKRCS